LVKVIGYDEEKGEDAQRVIEAMIDGGAGFSQAVVGTVFAEPTDDATCSADDTSLEEVEEGSG